MVRQVQMGLILAGQLFEARYCLVMLDAHLSLANTGHKVPRKYR